MLQELKKVQNFFLVQNCTKERKRTKNNKSHKGQLKC